MRSSLRSVMWRNAGIERSGERLDETREIIAFWSRYVMDKTFDPATLGDVSPESSLSTIELYDSALTVPDSDADVNLTALVTLENRAMIVLQITTSRAAYSEDLRSRVRAGERRAHVGGLGAMAPVAP